MGYNYSRSFLVANQELISQLKRLADESRYIKKVYPDPSKLHQERCKVNNILSSLARWEPSLVYIRKAVRTWVEFGPDGTWMLNIGVPPDGRDVRGRRPTPFEIEPVTRSASRFVIEEAITADNFPTIMLGIISASADPDVREIELVHPPEPEGVTFILSKIPIFELASSEPTVVFRRVA